jgi:hypothetical protein
MKTKTLAIITATLAIGSVNTLRADPSPTPARRDLERVIQNTQHFDNPSNNAPTAGHPDTSVRATTTVPTAGHSGSSETARGSGTQTTAPTQHTENPRPVLTKPTTTSKPDKPVKKEPPSPVVPTGDKKK